VGPGADGGAKIRIKAIKLKAKVYIDIKVV
jgi:hypothetical protein